MGPKYGDGFSHQPEAEIDLDEVQSWGRKHNWSIQFLESTGGKAGQTCLARPCAAALCRTGLEEKNGPLCEAGSTNSDGGLAGSFFGPLLFSCVNGDPYLVTHISGDPYLVIPFLVKSVPLFRSVLFGSSSTSKVGYRGFRLGEDILRGCDSVVAVSRGCVDMIHFHPGCMGCLGWV